jgi:hypothetical protein
LVDECQDSKERESVSKRANARVWLALSRRENTPVPVKELRMYNVLVMKCV